jgi:hypothetical protein
VKWLTATVVATFAGTTALTTQDVELSGFLFHLPASWTVRASSYSFVASLAPTFNPNVLPWVSGNACGTGAEHSCSPRDLDLSKDKQCPAIRRSEHEWAGGIKEIRWVCPLLKDKPGVRYSSTMAQFQTAGRKLILTYIATDHDTPPDEFLDAIGHGIKANDL